MSVDALYFVPDKQIQEVEEETSKDATLQHLKQVITEGWPSKKQDIPSCIQPYYNLRDTLSVQNGVIVKGERILIPYTLQKSILRKLPYAYLGLDSMLRRARNTVFWLNMTKDLRDTVNNCQPCQALRPANRKEPLLQHEIGEKPWEKIGMDLFEIENRSYLVMVDYFSNFTEVDYLPNPTSGEVIKKMKSLCARYGIPKVLVSDNGPQFASRDFKNFTQGWNISHHTSSP